VLRVSLASFNDRRFNLSKKKFKIGLSNIGYTLNDNGDGSEGLSMALAGDYSLLILDVMLPIFDGTTILKAIRKANKELKVLILSAQDLTKTKFKAELMVLTIISLNPFHSMNCMFIYFV
jgi:DNA-binding response OmpR family regulator